jgi:hypothetical protein
MAAQGAAGALDVSPLDRLVDASMLELNLLKIFPPLFGSLVLRTNRLAWDDDRS